MLKRREREQAPPRGRRGNRLSPLRFVVGFGLVSLLADFVYEGARAVAGPYLATLGASAAALVWGAAMGVHESTMRAAVADLVPAGRRGFGYGVFGAVYGLAWLGGAAAIGALYEYSVRSAELFVVAAQAVALLSFAPLWTHAPRLEPARRSADD